MGKLLKYEFIRTRLFLFISLLILVGVETLYLFGSLIKNEYIMDMGMSLFIQAVIAGFIAIIFSAVSRFFGDLKNRHGYMLFLTPRTSYEIVGSKVLMSFFIMAAGVIVVAGLGILNVQLYSNIYGDNTELITIYFEALLEEYDWSVILVGLNEVFAWFNMVLTIYFAISLTFTFFNNKKGKGFLAFLVYLGLSAAINGVTTAIMQPVEESMFNTLESGGISTYLDIMANGGYFYVGGAMLLNILFGVAMYFATSLLLEKKLSL